MPRAGRNSPGRSWDSPSGRACTWRPRPRRALPDWKWGGYEYGLADPLTVAAVVFGAVLVSPIAEETLFRGLVLGTLLGRGWHPVAAGATGILAFGVLHLPLLGPAGVIAMGAWSVVPTVLRLRFNSLGGAWAVHQFNNLWAYLGVVALGIG